MLAEQAWAWIFGMPQIVILMVCVIAVTGIVASYWYKAQKDRAELELKRTMVERGLSADEMERILATRPAAPRDSGA